MKISADLEGCSVYEYNYNILSENLERGRIKVIRRASI